MPMLTTNTKAYLLFDERMALHRPIYNPDDPDYFPLENPNRTLKVYCALMNLQQRLLQNTNNNKCRPNDVYDGKEESSGDAWTRFVELPCKAVTRETVELVHTREHYDWLLHTAFMPETKLKQLADPNDLYVCPSTFMAASLACGGVVECVNAVTDTAASGSSKITRAIALVRPPGHHAEKEEAMGTKAHDLQPCVLILCSYCRLASLIIRFCLLPWRNQGFASSTMWPWQPNTPLVRDVPNVSLFSIGIFIMAM